METLNNSHPASSAIIFDSALFLTRLTSKWLELVLEFSRIKNSDDICQMVVSQCLLNQGVLKGKVVIDDQYSCCLLLIISC